MAIRAYGKSVASYTAWVVLTEYFLEDYRVPTTDNSRCYECTTAGTSGITEPAWPIILGGTVSDGTVIWTCRDKESSPNPLAVELDTSGRGSLSLMEMWVKSDVECEFLMYGSHDGTDGTWRLIEDIAIPTKQGKYEKHDGYFNAYNHVRISVVEVGTHEIEIIAGEA